VKGGHGRHGPVSAASRVGRARAVAAVASARRGGSASELRIRQPGAAPHPEAGESRARHSRRGPQDPDPRHRAPEAGDRAMSSIAMVTAVWGDWHLDAHAGANLPTLLAPGNLPVLAGRPEMISRPHTRRSAVQRPMSV